MEQVKKMILIDPRMMEKLNNVNTDMKMKSIMDKMLNAKDLVLSSLDGDMSKVLTDPYMSDDRKVQQYTSAQARYNIINAPDSEKQENSEDKYIPDDVLPSIPKRLKIKGERLIEFVKKNPSLNFNARGELTIDGMRIANSHASDLINHALKKNKSVPIGWDIFQQHLLTMNIPRNILSVETVDKDRINRQEDKKSVQRQSVSPVAKRIGQRRSRQLSISPVSKRSRERRSRPKIQWEEY
jgi:hypothetical protein